MIQARVFPPDSSASDPYDIEAANDEALLRECRGICGPIDMGLATPYQYAIYEWALVHEDHALNSRASELLRRPTAGTIVVWGVGPSGESLDFDEVAHG